MPNVAERRQDHKCGLPVEILRSAGSLRLEALGMSMLPTIWPGDVLSLESLSSDSVVAGDIVLVLRTGRFFIHRAIEKRGDVWITRGDSMPKPDQTTGDDVLLGRVTKIERNGLAILPCRRRSLLNRALASALCYWDFSRHVALRMHARRRQTGPQGLER